MISPESFIVMNKDKEYKELQRIRDKLMRDIRYFENHMSETDGEIVCHPSPEVVYQMNLQYLGKLCELILEKYNEEYIWENEYKEEFENHF